MKIDIQALEFPLTEALRKYATWRLRCTLSIRDEYIQQVTVRLSDINGPRGGRDKCCQIQVTLDRLPDIVVQDIDTNLYNAIDRAISRTSRSVGRKITRRRTRARLQHMGQ